MYCPGTSPHWRLCRFKNTIHLAFHGSHRQALYEILLQEWVQQYDRPCGDHDGSHAVSVGGKGYRVEPHRLRRLAGRVVHLAQNPLDQVLQGVVLAVVGVDVQQAFVPLVPVA